MEFRDLSEWIMVDHCAVRIVRGGDINNVKDRVAFIEKTPRVRLDKDSFGLETGFSGSVSGSDVDGWLFGPSGSSDYGLDDASRSWCDEMLVLLGWS